LLNPENGAQYFFTIRGLREVILHCSELLEESDDIEKRVGGRRVSPKEIQRAKKCKLVALGLSSQ
jgi:hypothetical protein